MGTGVTDTEKNGNVELDAADLHRDGVEPAAAVGFGRQAGSYAKVRPAYPAAVMETLTSLLPPTPDVHVCDLAAGTGILTRQLLDSGYRVTAVEPVGGMREELERQLAKGRAGAERHRGASATRRSVGRCGHRRSGIPLV
jgi:hypothetical protein